MSALESGKVQAAMLNAPDNFRAQKRGLYSLVEVRLPYQGIGVGTARTLIMENPDVVRRNANQHDDSPSIRKSFGTFGILPTDRGPGKSLR